MAKKKEESLSSSLTPLEILKRFSKGGGLGEFVPLRPKLSTGSVALDLKLGGGIASDRIVEWFGKTGSFKTTMAMMTLKSHFVQFPLDSRPRVIVDLERTITSDFIRGFGIDPDKVWVEKPRTAEETMNFVSDVISSGAASWVLVDSIDAMESEEDTKKDYGESSMMKLAKLLSEAMRDLSKGSVDHNCSLQLINQIRAGSNGYTMVEVTSGGAAIPYYASQRIKCKRDSKATDDHSVGLSVQVVKNKLYPTVNADSSFSVIPGKGVDVASDRLSAGLSVGVIKSGGPYYSIMKDGELLEKFLGADRFSDWLLRDSNLALIDSLIQKVGKEIFYGTSGDEGDSRNYIVE